MLINVKMPTVVIILTLINKFIMLINIEMPTIVVGILIFISMINKQSESTKAKKIFIFQHFRFYEQMK